MMRTLNPTAQVPERHTHYCFGCGVPLRIIAATENASPHNCDGRGEWLGVTVDPSIPMGPIDRRTVEAVDDDDDLPGSPCAGEPAC